MIHGLCRESDLPLYIKFEYEKCMDISSALNVAAVTDTQKIDVSYCKVSFVIETSTFDVFQYFFPGTDTSTCKVSSEITPSLYASSQT